MVLLASFILLAALVGLTLRERENPTWPESLLIDSFGWVQGVVYAPVQHVAGFFEEIRNIKNLYDENAKLKAQLNEYSSMRVQIQVLERQNKQLTEDLGIKNRLGGLEMVAAANVIGRSPSTWNAEVTLDVGSKDGVSKDMAVITATRGLVGRVYEVTPYHCKVLLITDKTKFGISAMVQNNTNTPAYGIISGVSSNTSDDNKVRLEMTNIQLNTKVEKGQDVVTSGLSDIFPPALVIGKVTNVKDDKLGLTKTAEIEPAANLDYLEFLYVVKQSATGR
jgi:rod shape-determining protein MreC